MRLDEIERPSSAIEDEMSSLWPLEKIGGEILLMFRRYDNLFCHFFIERNKAVTTLLLHCQVIGKK